MGSAVRPGSSSLMPPASLPDWMHLGDSLGGFQLSILAYQSGKRRGGGVSSASQHDGFTSGDNRQDCVASVERQIPDFINPNAAGHDTSPNRESASKELTESTGVGLRLYLISTSDLVGAA
jgi:hypothetical protein